MEDAATYFLLCDKAMHRFAHWHHAHPQCFRNGSKRKLLSWHCTSIEQQVAQLRTWGALQAFDVQAVSSEHFYTTRTELAEVFKGRKQWLMEHFYRRMRQRHQVLMDEAGEPEGGQWNYDHDNRKP